MSGALYIGALGLEAQQRALDAIANNISNINTPAFKRSNVRFAEVLASQPDARSARADLGQSSITTAGVTADLSFMLNEQGRIEPTGQAMDIAIDGNGFLELMGPDGETLLWRGGTLKVDEDGMLATANGLPLKAAISVPIDAASIQIEAGGVVRAVIGDAGETIEIGQITLAKVENADDVQRLDHGLYRVTSSTRLVDAQPGIDGAGSLMQGAIERSTVDLTSEMVQMLLVQRAYGASAQLVQAADQLMALANGLRR